MLKLMMRYLFPDFSNRITNIVVLCGLGLLTVNWIEWLVLVLFDFYLNIQLTERNDLEIGFALVTLGLLHNLGYQLIKNSSLMQQLDPAYENDVSLFNEFLTLLPSSPTIENLKTIDFLSEVQRAYYEPLRTFKNEWDNAEHTFSNPVVERVRSELLESTQHLFSLIAHYTIPIDTEGLFASVRDKRQENYYEHEEQHRAKASEIDEALKLVIQHHQGLVRQGKKHYKVAL